MKVTEAEFQALTKRDLIRSPCLSPRHKFRAVPSESDGIWFGSKKERAYYNCLKTRLEVLFFLRQVPFHLPGNARHVIDFVEFWTDGTVHIVEVKGRDLPMGRLKRKQVEAIYPITIEVK
jgi:hypothetical protein